MKFWRKYHKWVGIVLCLLLMMFAISGIVLNHRQLFSSININRDLLTSSYQYKNWNNAALKGSIKLDSTLSLFYGNVGVWIYNEHTGIWTDFNSGFKKGIDNRKISKVIRTKNGRLFAATQFGLFEYIKDSWQTMEIPLKHPRICDLIEKDDELHILTRSELGLLNLTDANAKIEFNFLPTPEGYDNKTSLFKTIWVLHSGEILRFTGKLLVDAVAIIFIFLCITAIIWFIYPFQLKRKKRKQKDITALKRTFRFTVKWHNKIGYYTLILLVFTTFTGMFLRPPLLITIANSKVINIPYSMLDTPNAWYDQLRSIRFNKDYDVYFVSTSNGMYALTSDRQQMIKIPHQPPISVMGINVFEQKSKNTYLIGSFSGLFLWNPFDNTTHDYLSGTAYRPKAGMARPVSSTMATGYFKAQNDEHYFDYSNGAILLNGKHHFPEMPMEIKAASPLSFWNFALEIHTGRIFQDFIGSFYILIVPLVGIATIVLLFSGLWIYIKVFRKNKD